MNKWEKIDFKGYVVHGSNGEYAFTSNQEKIELVKEVKKRSGKGKLIMAGSGCESTQATIDMTKAMADAGADCALVITPCYYKANMNDAAMLHHFTKVADSVPIPVVLYSVPGNTVYDLPVGVIDKLSAHDNIIGLKDSGGDITKIGLVVKNAIGKDFKVLCGSAGFLYAGFHVGAVGGVCAFANVLGQECVDL